MKVLFVSAGDRHGNPREVVRNQGLSLIERGVELRFFCVTGGGVRGYLRAIPELRRELARYNPDVVHAHYSFSGFVASLAGVVSPVVSLMGSEASAGLMQRLAIRFFAHRRWGITIVKTTRMAEALRLPSATVLPNGVNTDCFTPGGKEEAAALLRWSRDKINVIFVADPAREEKNFTLAEQAVVQAGADRFRLIPVSGVPNRELASYYNAADILLLTSLWEGSPNVIKEAMACCCPVVATDVGDVRWIVGEMPGTFVTTDSVGDVAAGLLAAASFAESKDRTDGRKRIFELGLDAASVAEKLKELYGTLISKRQTDK